MTEFSTSLRRTVFLAVARRVVPDLASLFPRCSEINPYVTIMAPADRVAERVRERIAEV